MNRESLASIGEFYSDAAHYPLNELRPGTVTVSGSESREPAKGRCVLYAVALADRSLISAWHELVPDLEALASQTGGPDWVADREMRRKMLQLCQAKLGEEVACYTYSGIKLYCDGETYRHSSKDENVRKITRGNAGEVITHLLEEGIPDDVDYLLADGAAYAYFLESEPVAFAGTHPVGGSGRIGNVMVGTREGFRRMGFGKAVVSATTSALLDQGRIAVYGTSDHSVASIRTAQSAGYQVYCKVFEVRLAGACAGGDMESPM